jgi:aryl-alcohol dehydrogenase-like predicted oxidoreductase
MRLALGTVQFGVPYGISNRDGICPPDEVERILTLAATAGVSVLDTAPTYGDSEAVLGSLHAVSRGFDVVTKTVASPHVGGTIEQGLDGSLQRLRRDSVYALLAHDSNDLLGPDGPTVYRALRSVRDAGKVRKIGASVYTGSQIDALLLRYQLDVVQLPINVLDQRLVVGGQLARLKDHGVEIHARSVFLQGLLVMPLAQIPPHLAPLRAVLADYRATLDEASISPIAAALGFVGQIAEIDKMVIGVCSRTEFNEVAAAMSQFAPAIDVDWRRFSVGDVRMIDPRQWPQ